MKKNLLLVASAIMLSLCACDTKNKSNEEAASSPETQQTPDSAVAEKAAVETAETMAVDPREEAAKAIKRGIYITTTKCDVKTKPSDSASNMESFFDGGGRIKLSKGEWLEADGKVENGYARVKEHLIEDQSEGLWLNEYGWVPADCIKPAKCNHSHMMADGEI